MILPWLLLAVHIALGLAASWWLRRGEAALYEVLRAVGASAFRPLLRALATALSDATEWQDCIPRRPLRTTGPLVSRTLQHSVVRRGPPEPVAA